MYIKLKGHELLFTRTKKDYYLYKFNTRLLVKDDMSYHCRSSHYLDKKGHFSDINRLRINLHKNIKHNLCDVIKEGL